MPRSRYFRPFSTVEDCVLRNGRCNRRLRRLVYKPVCEPGIGTLGLDVVISAIVNITLRVQTEGGAVNFADRLDALMREGDPGDLDADIACA